MCVVCVFVCMIMGESSTAIVSNTSRVWLISLSLSLSIHIAGANMMVHLDTKGTSLEKSEVDLGVSTKGQAEDFCTAIDLLNESIVTDAIRRSFPSHKIIGEESTGTDEPAPLTTDPTWIIDPIDGTANFASGLPLACVSIGYCVGGKPVLGVVYAPATDELYMAIRGHGAYRNRVRIVPHNSNDKTLERAVVNYEFGYARDEASVSRMVRAVQNVVNHGCRTTRTLGSGVLDICYVASGRLDVVYAGVASEGWKPWDYCAGLVVALETNCAVQALVQDQEEETEDKEFSLYSKSIICAVSKTLLDEARSVILQGL